MRREDKLDQLLRERVENYAPDPPEWVWNSVQAEISAPTSKRKVSVVRWAAAAAILLIATTTFLLIDRPQDVQLASDQKTIPGTTISPAIEPREDNPVESPSAVEALQVAHSGLSGSDQVSAKSISNNAIKNQNIPSEKCLSDNRYDRLIAMESRAVRNLFGDDKIHERQKLVIPADRLTPEDQMIIAANLADRNESKYQELGGWKLGVHVSPSFSSHNANHSDSYASNMTYSADNSDATMGGGISVQYKTNSRWRVESGMYYSKTGGSSGNSMKSRYAEADFVAAPGSAEKYFNTLVNSDRGQIEMNSTAGVIRFDGTPAQAEMITMPVGGFGLTTAMLSPGEFTQVFDFVEIPLFVRYLLYDSRLDVEWVGGVSSNLTVGNNVYMESNNNRERVGTTDDISTFSFAGTTGIGLAYSLGKNLSLSVEPRFTYYLSSINHGGDVNFRPWRLGVYTGLSYEF